jgi:hypothetical protein
MGRRFPESRILNRKRVQIQGKLATNIYWESGSIAVQLRVGYKVLFDEE